jgi:hypothetical protein
MAETWSTLDAAIFRRINGPLSTGVGDVVLSWR